MKFTLQINLSPYQHQCVNSAYQFACQAIAQGHVIERVFFYHDGVYTANKLMTPPQDETNIMKKWVALTNDNKGQIDKVICIASALKRGVLDEKSAVNNGHQYGNMATGFKVGGLGQLIEAIVNSDRLLVFGG